MYQLKYLAILIMSVGLINPVFSQNKSLEPNEIYLVKELPKIRASDVMWHRRVWREIDLTEKINQHLFFSKNNPFPEYCLFDILLYYINKGLLIPYSSIDAQFTIPLSLTELTNVLNDTITNNTSHKKEIKTVNNREVVKLWLKEDWIYDSKNSKIDVRIVGICPVRIKRDMNGNIMGYEQLFWLYFPNIRGTLVNYNAFKKELTNDERISFDEVFLDRMFNSYIINRSTDIDKHVRNNKTELDVKLELDKTRYYELNTITGYWN